MRQIDLTIEIAGSSGDGTLAAGEILATTLSEQGYYILGYDVYPAEIRGFGKCVSHIRVSEKPVQSVGRNVDILVSLNDPYAIDQLQNVKPNGVVIFDSWPIQEVSEEQCVAGHLQADMHLYGVPLGELSEESTHSHRSRNLVSLGALAGLFQIDVESFAKRLRYKFRKKKGIAEQVEAAFRAGVEYVKKEIIKLDSLSFSVSGGLTKKGDGLILTGNQAAAKGAIDAKCRFYSGYPITPATKIMELLSESLTKEGGVVVQSEDEIAAIGMVTGAGLVGERAMTATSGPGLCLMTEFIGYNVMVENPVVIVDSQRGGPATGLPTKTEQSDLMMALFAGNGDAPRIVLAPTNVSECHYWIYEAFYLAEKYQMPVIVLMDLFLSTCRASADLGSVDPAKLEAHKLPNKKQMKAYSRFKNTKDGVSPRTLPGMEGGEMVVSGLEQDEDESVSYHPDVHTKMTEKRLRKLRATLKRDVPRPQRIGRRGKVRLGILSWGSTMGAVVEAVEEACEKGLSVAALKQIVLNPLHEDRLKAFFDDCEQILVPELNNTGQFADWLSMHIDKPIRKLNRVTCSPLSYIEVLEEIERLIGE